MNFIIMIIVIKTSRFRLYPILEKYSVFSVIYNLKYIYSLLLELKQISEISGYPFQIHYPDTGFELFRIVANYFKQL